MYNLPAQFKSFVGHIIQGKNAPKQIINTFHTLTIKLF